MFSAGVNGDSAYMTSGVLMPGALDERVARALVSALSAAPGERTIVNIHDGGGAIRAGGQGGAFVHRGFNLIYQVKAIWAPSTTADAQNMQWATALKDALTPSLSGAPIEQVLLVLVPMLSFWKARAASLLTRTFRSRP